MRRLTEKQRAFVRAVVERPTAKGETLSRVAGFENTPGGHRVHAHRLLHSQKILDAIDEETDKRVRLGGVIGIAALVKIASNPKHKQHVRAAESLADRAGRGAVSRQEISVNHSDQTGATMVERIKQLAAVLGVNPAQLLGVNAPAPKLIEGTTALEHGDGE